MINIAALHIYLVIITYRMNTIWGKSVNTFLTEVNFQFSSVFYAHQCFTSEAQRLKNMANISLLSSLQYRRLAYTSDT